VALFKNCLRAELTGRLGIQHALDLPYPLP
jgi:hypothetical protein